MIASAFAMVAVLALMLRLRPTAVRAAHPLTHRRARSQPDWAAFLDMIAGDVRAGSSLRFALDGALTHHAPLGQAIRPGLALDMVHEARTSDPDEAIVVRAVASALRLGGPVAGGLHAAAALLRDRAATRAEATAHSAQARLSAQVLTAVPLLFCTWSAMSSQSFRATLLTGPGTVAAAAGVVCNLLGWWWMRRVIAGASR